MTDKRILFDEFEFPRLRGLEYLLDEEKPVTEYLFVNEPRENFSMYFEKDFPIFTVPEGADKEYCLFEVKRPGRTVKFFCPEKRKNIDSVVWYFCVEVLDGQGIVHILPGQVRVTLDSPCALATKPKFLEVLETVALATATT